VSYGVLLPLYSNVLCLLILSGTVLADTANRLSCLEDQNSQRSFVKISPKILNADRKPDLCHDFCDLLDHYHQKKIKIWSIQVWFFTK